jgi:hypothetical protein
MIHKSFTCLWQVYPLLAGLPALGWFMRLRRIYPPQADEPYMHSLSRFGLLESRVRRVYLPVAGLSASGGKTTLQIVSILICRAAQRVVNYDDSS